MGTRWGGGLRGGRVQLADLGGCVTWAVIIAVLAVALVAAAAVTVQWLLGTTLVSAR
jgi:hypothetical protein